MRKASRLHEYPRAREGVWAVSPLEPLALCPKPVMRALRMADFPEPFFPTMKLTCGSKSTPAAGEGKSTNLSLEPSLPMAEGSAG